MFLFFYTDNVDYADYMVAMYDAPMAKNGDMNNRGNN